MPTVWPGAHGLVCFPAAVVNDLRTGDGQHESLPLSLWSLTGPSGRSPDFPDAAPWIPLNSSWRFEAAPWRTQFVQRVIDQCLLIG